MRSRTKGHRKMSYGIPSYAYGTPPENKLPPIVYVKPTPEEAEFLRRERELFDLFAFGDLLDMVKQEKETV